ncbi:MAG: AbrB/MazE/SpoVT family DNA-binding domain-containing protein [Candidatus Nezhaarchaeota archaeon]|nr:AbrB/MazE/SpoVT family DNA-binding domain-containing protein [Candidatus Nezhaarchaeota archaeon]
MSSIESRKVQVGAGGSYLLVLPKEWARRVGLQKGDRLDIVIEEDGSLRVAPPSLIRRPMLREAVIELERLSNIKWLDRCIKAAYMQGYDVVSIASKNRIPPEVKGAVRASMLDLIGMEVADIQPSKMVLRILVDPLKFPLAELRERMFSLLLSSVNDLTLFLERGEEGVLQDVMDREKEVAKLYRLMIRQSVLAMKDREVARTVGVARPEDALTNIMVARDSFRLALLSSRAAGTLLSVKGRPLPSEVVGLLLTMSKEATSMLSTAFRAASLGDQSLAHSVMDLMEKVKSLDGEVLRSLVSLRENVEVAPALSAVARDLRRIAGCAVAIADSVVTGAALTKIS